MPTRPHPPVSHDPPMSCVGCHRPDSPGQPSEVRSEKGGPPAPVRLFRLACSSCGLLVIVLEVVVAACVLLLRSDRVYPTSL